MDERRSRRLGQDKRGALLLDVGRGQVTWRKHDVHEDGGNGRNACLRLLQAAQKTCTKTVGSFLVYLVLDDVGVSIGPGRSNILYNIWREKCNHRSIVLWRSQYYVESRTVRSVVAW